MMFGMEGATIVFRNAVMSRHPYSTWTTGTICHVRNVTVNNGNNLPRSQRHGECALADHCPGMVAQKVGYVHSAGLFGNGFMATRRHATRIL
jgi:hypothetical protein